MAVQNLAKICSQGLLYKYAKYNDIETFCTFPFISFPFYAPPLKAIPPSVTDVTVA